MLTLDEIKAALNLGNNGLSDQECLEIASSIRALAGIFVDSILATSKENLDLKQGIKN